jgi:serine/threonine-protein kinase
VVLELLSGPTLEQEISVRRRQGRHFSGNELLGIFEPILDGLAFAHGRGIMHRDIKPSNIVLSRGASGALEPKILDFGTARTQLSALQTSLGKTGFTPLYGAPEQWDPGIAPPTLATDVYALGLTLLECATLQRPHAAADSLPAIMRAVLGGTGTARVAEARPDLPRALDEVVARALAVQPAQRFRDASELRAALRAALTSTSPGASTTPPVNVVARWAPPPPTPTQVATPPPGFRTTAPFVASQPAPSSASRISIVAVVLAGLALVSVLGIGGAFIYFGRGSERVAGAPLVGSTPGGAAAAKPISSPLVGSSEEFDTANAVAVTQKNHARIEACAAKSHRFNGTIDVVLDVSARDGRVVGTDCHTVWPTHDSKHPKLDPEAIELCSCIQTVTPTWKFKPPKPEIAMPIFEDTVWLHVHYRCAK